MRSMLFSDITQRWVVILYWRYGQNIGPVSKGQEVQEEEDTSVKDYRLMLRNMPEGRKSPQVKSRFPKLRELT